MKPICVVTGGGSGMGFETARILGRTHHVILAGRTVSKLEDAVEALRKEGVEAEAFPCDASSRTSVKELVQHAADAGEVKTVIHAAGVSPHMADGEKIFSINALGTIHIDEEFAQVMPEGSCILNVSSMSAYMLPAQQVPKQVYKLALHDETAFMNAAGQMIASVPQDKQPGMAYTISKNFVVWYTSRMAVRYGAKGIRVVSISPGTFKTPMGEIEGEEAAAFAMRGALGRLGEPEEIAKMMAFMVSSECSYLSGTDILYDGGAVSALQAVMEDRQE